MSSVEQQARQVLQYYTVPRTHPTQKSSHYLQLRDQWVAEQLSWDQRWRHLMISLACRAPVSVGLPLIALLIDSGLQIVYQPLPHSNLGPDENRDQFQITSLLRFLLSQFYDTKETAVITSMVCSDIGSDFLIWVHFKWHYHSLGKVSFQPYSD